MPCVGKLQAKPERKMLAVGWWHRFAKKSQSNIYRRLHFRLQFNSRFPPPTRMRIICFSVGRSEKGSFTAFQDGKWLDEMAVVAGAAHHKMEKAGRWNGSWMWFFYELGSECSDPSHCENSVETKPPLEPTWTVYNLWVLRNKLLTDRIRGDICQE